MKPLLLSILLLLSPLPLTAQGSFHIPGAKTVKDMRKALVNPQAFALLLPIEGSDTVYATAQLDLLDSAYRIAFNPANPNYYVITIEGYGGSDEALTKARVDAVARYFSARCHAPFPIRYAINPIHCSCHGDTTEMLRFEVPVDRRYYDCSQLPDSRKLLNGTVKLENSVLISFRNNPEECIGPQGGCYIPAQDSTIMSYYASVHITKGALYSVHGTRDTCPSNLEFSIEEHLDPTDVVEHYFLVPHRKQIIMQVGYIVLRSNMARQYQECSQPLADSIFIRIPVTQEQIDGHLRFFVKKYSEKGCEYKSIPTKKMPSKVALAVQGAINATQIDTIFYARRIQPNELDYFFYEVETNIETGTFTVAGHHYKAFRDGKNGEREYRKAFRQLLRIVESQGDEELADPTGTTKPDKKPGKKDRKYASDEAID
ncbi:MAG: hypothetical protein IJU81_05725 [Bacteroidales bacterium]|nr:hypothetical protein [Bacteroidales bacterium]